MADEYKKMQNQSIVNNEKIVVSIKDNEYNDIFDVCRKKFNNFVNCWNYGPNGHSIFEHNESNSWTTTSNSGYHEFKIVFNHHTVRLTSFAYCTSMNSNYETGKPIYFSLYGYNNKTNRWKIIFNYPYSGKIGRHLRYSHEIKDQCFYKVFQFISLSSPLSLSYLQLYGDVKNDETEMPNSVVKSVMTNIEYDETPLIEALDDPNQFCRGIFKKAMEIYGSDLRNFVSIYFHQFEDFQSYDVWGARNECYKSIVYNKPNSLDIHFLEHDIYIKGYQIRNHESPGISSWCVVGCEKPYDTGVVLDYRINAKLDDCNAYYSYEINENNDKPFRTIRFIGLNRQYSFKSIDFYGIAKPGKSKPFTDEELGRSYYYPSKVNELFNSI